VPCRRQTGRQRDRSFLQLQEGPADTKKNPSLRSRRFSHELLRVSSFLAHHHEGGPPDYLDNGVAVLEYDRAFGIIEVPALEVAPASRRIEVYGTDGAMAIPHLGSGHLENPNLQPIEVYRKGGKERWERLDLTAATLHLADLREFAACALRKKEPDYGLDHDLAVQEVLLKASRMV